MNLSLDNVTPEVVAAWEKLTVTNPLVHSALTLADMGHVTSEEALVLIVVNLANQNQRLEQASEEFHRRQPLSFVISQLCRNPSVTGD